MIATAKDEQALLGVGLYAPAEASRLLQIPETTLARWVKGYTYALRSGARRRGHPVVKRSEALARTLTFVDLAELLMVKGFRVAGVSLDRIRVAAETAADLFQTTHPLAIESGNTWTRTFLHNLVKIQRGEDEEQDINDMNRFSTWELDKKHYTRFLGFEPKNNQRKEIASPTLSPRGFAYVAYRLHEQGASSRALITTPVWRQWLLPDERVAELYDLDAHRVRLAVEFEDELAAA